MDLAAELKDDGGHFHLGKQPKVAFVTADAEVRTQVLMQGELPALQGHLRTEDASILLQSLSIRQVAIWQFLVQHSHSDLHVTPAYPSCAPNGTADGNDEGGKCCNDDHRELHDEHRPTTMSERLNCSCCSSLREVFCQCRPKGFPYATNAPSPQ